MKAASTTSTNTTRLATASLCWKNRRITIWRCVRAVIVNSRSTGGPPGPPGPPVATTLTASTDVTADASSCVPDPRVERGVEDVGEQVERDDERAGDEQPREDDVGVASSHRVDE